MTSGFLTTPTDLVLSKTLDAAALRHSVIAQNIANVDTPLYKRQEVAFEDSLKQALEKPPKLPMTVTHPVHISNRGPGLGSVAPRVYTAWDTTGRVDGNNVDIDAEMAKLSENTLLYNSVVQLVSRRLGTLRSVIAEGRR